MDEKKTLLKHMESSISTRTSERDPYSNRRVIKCKMIMNFRLLVQLAYINELQDCIVVLGSL